MQAELPNKTRYTRAASRVAVSVEGRLAGILQLHIWKNVSYHERRLACMCSYAMKNAVAIQLKSCPVIPRLDSRPMTFA